MTAADVEGQPKFPDVVVPLIGEDGNGFMIVGRVRKALRKGGATPEQIEQFAAEATSGTYADLLDAVGRWVTIE